MSSNEASLQKKGSASIQNGAKQLPHEFYITFGSKEAAVEELRRNSEEHEEHVENLMQI